MNVCEIHFFDPNLQRRTFWYNPPSDSLVQGEINLGSEKVLKRYCRRYCKRYCKGIEKVLKRYCKRYCKGIANYSSLPFGAGFAGPQGGIE